MDIVEGNDALHSERSGLDRHGVEARRGALEEDIAGLAEEA
jgi:hypothetical protein